MAIKASDAIRAARALLGTPYSEIDCIGLIVRVIRTAPGGVPSYRTAGTNTIWRSADSSEKYRDLTWRQESTAGARAGMLAFKRRGEDIHHVGLVTDDGTVIHSSSAKGGVVETPLDGSWDLLAVHRYIEAAGGAAEEEEKMEKARGYAQVVTQSTSLNLRSTPGGEKIGSMPRFAKVELLDDSDSKWWRVRYEGMTGYASAEYLIPGSPPPESEDEEEDGVEDSGWMSGDPDGVVAEALPMTTLIREDGVSIVMAGRWRVEED